MSPASVADSSVGTGPWLCAVGTAVPEQSYTQRELLDEFRISDPRVRSLFLNSAIERRHLTLPPRAADGTRRTESQGDLLRKHATSGVALGRRAVEACLARLGADAADIEFLCCVSSTGLLTPGLSALLLREMGLRESCARLDVVGMGCNAGLNGLSATAGWTAAHPGGLALMVCVEVCSAAYVFDGTMRSAVVNSLFGDGAAAVAVTRGPQPGTGPQLLRFASRVIPRALGAMRYDWDEDHGKFSFFLDPQVPYVVGAHVEEVVDRLLAGTGLRRGDIAHWLVHSGGKKVIDSVRVNLGLSRHAVRHTTAVLRDFGNLSSGSFLFSYERLAGQDRPAPGEHGVLMTMGPGSTIETALVRW